MVVTVLVVVTHVGFLFGAGEASRLNSLFGEVDFFLDRRLKMGSTFNGVLVEANVLGVVLGTRSVYGGGISRAEALTIFTLSDVNGRTVRAGAVVNLNTSIGVLGASRSGVFLHKLLLLGTGTAVMLFSDADLFLAVALLLTRGEIDVGSVRRVLLLPSGWLLLVGKLEINLLVGLCGGLRFAVPIRRREDAEGDRDAGFKVQIGDFCWRERIFSYNLP